MKRTAVWKCLVVGLLAAPLPFACGPSEKTPDAAIPGRDAATPLETPAAVDVQVALDVALGADAPLGIDAVGIEAAGTAVDVGTAIDVGTVVDVGTACTIVPAFKGGKVAQDLTLTRACSPYAIDQSVSVEGNATLTIEPGVTLKFKKDVPLTIGSASAGKLVADGTAALPITLTTSSATPTAGDWTGIQLNVNTMAGTRLSYVVLDYCGKTNGACVAGWRGLPIGTVTMGNVTVDHVGATSDGILQDHNTFKITNTTFNAGAIAAGRSAISLDAASFAGIGSGNVFNNAPINVNGGTIDTSATWINPGTPIVVKSTFAVDGTTSPVLTLSPGTLMKFDANTGVRIVSGGLVAEGTALAPIAFTSFAATPGPGDWRGLQLEAGTAGGTKLAYVGFDYCGQVDGGCIDIGGGNSVPKPDRVAIDHVTFAHVGAKASAIRELPNDAHYQITNCTFAPGAIQTGQYAIHVMAGSFAGIGSGNVFNDAPIKVAGGTLDTSATWINPATPIVVTANVFVNGTSSPVLTLSPGTVMKFDSQTNLQIVNGGLVAEGTALAPIALTSLAATPSPGDWRGVELQSGTAGGTKLAYVNFDYCGQTDGACIDIGGGNSAPKPDRVAIDHVTFAHVGAKANAIRELPADARYKITNCTFAPGAIQAGQYAIYVLAASFAGIGAGNVYNGALIDIDGGTVSTTTDWSDPGTPIAVTKGIVVAGPTTPVLTVAAGSILKFAANAYLWVGLDASVGKFVASGTATDRVTFTSLASSPSPGDWEGIVVNMSNQAVIDYADIQYAGGSHGSLPVGGVVVQGNQLDSGKLTMTNSTVSNSAGYGVNIACRNSGVSLIGCTFTNNAMADQGPGPVCP